MQITNKHDISLPLAVWLLTDDYDYIQDERYISATSFLKPTRQIILSSRIAKGDKEADVSDFLASRMGSAIHDSVDKAWSSNAARAMKLLGYPDHIADNIAVNPTPEQIEANPNILPVWIEKREIREIEVDGKTWRVGGKFDMVIDGRLFDIKTTSVYAYIKGTKDEDYAMQGSIYRWLNPDKIDSEHIFILFLFTDWQASMKRTEGYPQIKTAEHPVVMNSPEDTLQFMQGKIRELSRLWDAPQSKLPECTPKELWLDPPKYKFYLDPEKAKDPTAKSSKNCDTLAEAKEYQASKGGRGVIVTKPGVPKACGYCAAFDTCEQRKRMLTDDGQPV
jgi:hypothetical protein